MRSTGLTLSLSRRPILRLKAKSNPPYQQRKIPDFMICVNQGSLRPIKITEGLENVHSVQKTSLSPQPAEWGRQDDSAKRNRPPHPPAAETILRNEPEPPTSPSQIEPATRNGTD